VKEVEGPRIRILVAEDHPVVSDGIVAILSTAKDIVVIGQARDGAQAIEMLRQHQPDIVLLDLRMPVVDGIGVMRWIRSSVSTTHSVILTGFSSPGDVTEAIRAGAKAYLLKDMSAAEILKTIRRVYKSKSRTFARRTRGPTMNSAALNPSELAILALIVQGCDNRTIGKKLGLRTHALKYRMRKLFVKLDVRKRAVAARRAIECGIIPVNTIDKNPPLVSTANF
jgi:two-component system NarL family response regulator